MGKIHSVTTTRLNFIAKDPKEKIELAEAMANLFYNIEVTQVVVFVVILKACFVVCVVSSVGRQWQH